MSDDTIPRVPPPSEWAAAEPLGGDVYWRYDRSATEPADVLRSVLMWHWCPKHPLLRDEPAGEMVEGRWVAANVAAHDLVSIDPLHLEPSLLWECCGKHGWVRAGAWTDA